MENLLLVVIALLITGIAIAYADEKAVMIGEEPPRDLTLKEALYRTWEYFQFSISVFTKGKGEIGWRGIFFGVFRDYKTTPRELFQYVTGITPETTVLTTLSLLTIVMLIVLPLGLYWGLHAGYRGGLSDKILLILAPVFSGIPAWFWGLFLLWTLWWKFDIGTISYLNYIHREMANGGPGISDYFTALLIPLLALTIGNIAVYAFHVRNFVKKEVKEDYFFADVMKGLPERRILRKLLRTVTPSFLTYTSYNFLNLMINGMALEKLFDVPGIGFVLTKAIDRFYVFTGDGWAPMFYFNPYLVFFVAFIMAILYFLNSTIMEALYLRLDPRREVYGED
ncbi:hypothetical protein A0127_06120 [Thermococcus peptonophilus]|uniref:ABC transmembrane type-1 domain-containing protein n=2 Tax=Thermococcus peptonophilus TaxID=53952 RepID=A0A142CVH5_9EURY|nr:hypothetical protein A0127_06120 [Thermococcus peptonophilus]